MQIDSSLVLHLNLLTYTPLFFIKNLFLKSFISYPKALEHNYQISYF